MNLRRLEGAEQFRTGVWRVPERIVRQITDVWLHEGQKLVSYHGGRIVSYRPALPEDADDAQPDNYEGRWTFIYGTDPLRMRTMVAGGQWKNFSWTVTEEVTPSTDTTRTPSA